jgi:hypothetical protein
LHTSEAGNASVLAFHQIAEHRLVTLGGYSVPNVNYDNREIAMNRDISRRDFINGVAIEVADRRASPFALHKVRFIDHDARRGRSEIIVHTPQVKLSSRVSPMVIAFVKTDQRTRLTLP